MRGYLLTTEGPVLLSGRSIGPKEPRAACTLGKHSDAEPTPHHFEDLRLPFDFPASLGNRGTELWREGLLGLVRVHTPTNAGEDK